MKWLAALVGLYALACAGFLVKRADLIYPFDAADYPTSVAGPDVAKVDLDGLEVWVHDGGPTAPVVLHFTGNIGNPGRIGPVLRDYNAGNVTFVVPRYRRDGASEAQLIADARRVHDALPALLGRPVPVGQIIIRGHSLGSAIATGLAQQVTAAGLVLESPFTRLCALGSVHFPGLPYCLLDGGHRFDTAARIGDVGMPVLILHGGEDGLVPVEMGRQVFAAARDPKRLTVYPEANHNDLRLFGAGLAVRAFAAEVTAGLPAPL